MKKIVKTAFIPEQLDAQISDVKILLAAEAPKYNPEKYC